MPRPNILLLFTDQQRADALGCVNPVLRTPHLDRLAAGGLHVERAYAPTPVCLPCRASIVTGQYPSTHGAMHNESWLPAAYQPRWAETFGRHGYFTHYVGKAHFNSCHDPSSPECLPFTANRAYYRAWHGPWYGFEHADLSIGHSCEHITCHEHYGVWLEDHGIDVTRFFGRHQYTAYGPWDLPEEVHHSAWVAERTCDSIRRCAEREQPFLIWANFPDPHNPCVVPQPWASMYSPADLPTYGYKPGEPEALAAKPPFYRELAQDSTRGCHPSDPGLPGTSCVARLSYSPAETQANAACYYGMVSLLDKYVGRILDALDETGQAENTLIVFTSDHGDLLGDHGLWWKGLVAYEECLRVPFLVRFPGRVPAGTHTGALHSLVDLAPTFLDYAGLPAPPGLEGVSQRPTWETPACATRASVVVEERPYDTDFTERFLITPEWKLCVYAGRTYGELYHTAADPHQVRNLWDDPAHARQRRDLTDLLLTQELTKHGPRPTVSACLSGR